ncbi:MAG: hypothetical protein J6X63_06680 [Bacteroidales bacterium]|nr:hypothetical protein [Bacteroidales bacterium]MDT3360651.1 hypothetical protein [Bacteroidota bacterium]
MKNLTKFLLLAAIVMFAACRKSDETHSLTPDSFTYDVEATAGTVTINFKSNVKDYTVQTECEWIRISAKSANSITVAVSANEETSVRGAEIRFYDGETLLNKVVIKQKAAAATIKLGSNKIDVDASTTYLEFNFEANFEYIAEVSESWMSLKPFTKLIEVSTITLYLKPNNDNTGRTGYVTIKDKSSQKEMAKVEIAQAAPVYKGFYFVNEGQWGKNNASMGYFDFSTSQMTNSWWQTINPTVRGSLGDVANDVVADGQWLLVVVNSSNLLEICNRDGKHLGEVEIPNCRMVAVDGDIAYVTSYANDGYVAKVDLEQKKVVATCQTGYEPEGLALLGGKLYVINSCSYHTDFTGGGNNEISSVSIINTESFTETERVSLGIVNAYSAATVMPDGKSLFINSSGDYNSIAATSIIFDTATKTVTKNFGFGGTYACVYNSKLYIFETSFSYTTFEWENNNCVYDPATGTISDFPIDEEEFYTYGAPSGIWINPVNGDIYIADKGNYVSPAFLYRYDKDGEEVAKYDVGVCPGHLAWDWR